MTNLKQPDGIINDLCHFTRQVIYLILKMHLIAYEAYNSRTAS